MFGNLRNRILGNILEFMDTECTLISNKYIAKIKNLNFDWNYFKIFTRLSQKRFKQLVERLLQFISLRLFPAKPEEFPPITKCSWWIPSASKVLALLSTFYYSIIFSFVNHQRHFHKDLEVL